MKIEIICLNCNSSFKTKPCLKNIKKFCSKNCYTEFQTGKKLSEEIKNKIGESLKGHNISEETKQRIRTSLLGKKHSIKRKENISKGHRGEKHPNWAGGSTFLIRIRRLYEYSKWRTKIFERDEYTCQKCGEKGGKLVAHHIKKFSTIIKVYNIKNWKDSLKCEELWDVNNGITYCKLCHKKIHWNKI